MMSKLIRNPFRALVLGGALPLAMLAGAAGAQSLERAVPAAGGPGDLIILRGTGLASIAEVSFTANTGGFAGFFTRKVTPLSVTDTEIRVEVPLFNGFVGPLAIPPSGPFGNVNVVVAPGELTPPPLEFFFFEEPTAELEAVGQGGALSHGQGASVTSFALKEGPPKVPDFLLPPPYTTDVLIVNSNFTLQLENAMPGAPAVVLFGAPAAEPYVPIGTGDLVVDLAAFVGFFAGITDTEGDLAYPVPLPATISGTLMMQFVSFDGISGQLETASGLQAVL